MAHGGVLAAFAEAMVGEDNAVLAQARQQVVDAVGPESMIDAAGVASNFERMVRIADSTGIALDERTATLSQEARAELGLNQFAGAQNMM